MKPVKLSANPLNREEDAEPEAPPSARGPFAAHSILFIDLPSLPPLDRPPEPVSLWLAISAQNCKRSQFRAPPREPPEIPPERLRRRRNRGVGGRVRQNAVLNDFRRPRMWARGKGSEPVPGGQ